MKKAIVLSLVAALLLSLATVSVLAQGLQNVELHGYSLNRFYANPNYSARFVIERVSLSAVGQIGTDGTAYIETYFHPWLTDRTFTNSFGANATADEFRTYIESAYVDLPLANGRIRFGKGRQLNFGLTPSYPNRKTTQYGIISETFTQDRIVGAQYDCKLGTLDVGASLYSDQQVETRKIGEFAGSTNTSIPNATSALPFSPTPDNALITTVQHLVDKDDPGEISGRLAFSTRIGITKPNYQIHISGATGGLSQNDANFIAKQYDRNFTTDKTHNKYGIDGSYSRGRWVLQSELYQGNFSFVKITGYDVLLGYQPKDKMRGYIRWAALNNDQMPNANQTTWDTQQLTFAVIQPIRNNVWAEVDYEKNTENPGGGNSNKKNDMLFLEVFTGF